MTATANPASPVSEREIFTYFDGEKIRYADPIACWRSIWNHPTIDLAHEFKVTANPKMADGERPYTKEEMFAAEDRIRELMRDVFKLKPWSEESPGLTVGETDNLLTAFMAYVTDIKKKLSPSVTTSQALESMEPRASTDSTEFPTNTSADSGSTAIESSAAEPSGL